MTISTDISPPGTVDKIDQAHAGLGHAIGSLATRVTAWIESCADYYASAAIYAKLSKLSDTELRHRGLSRADLARLCDRTE